jgi:peptidoglycan hydrolase-like protein with peptidoglycan-binding domain
MNFQFAESVDPNKPIYTFANDLKFSATVTYGNPDIVALQNCLKYLGLFPINTESTGYFGALTKKGVMDFQKKYGFIPDGVVGKITRSKLNELFSK